MADELLTADEIAERLCVQRETIRRLVREGIIPEVKISEKIRRFEWQAVVEALRQRGVANEHSRGC